MFRSCLIVLFLLAHSLAAAPTDHSRQIIVGIAPDWNSSQGHLQLFNKTDAGWQAASPVFSVLFGKEGLAWGVGMVVINDPGLRKKERDKRAPAGIFRIGRIYTYDPALPAGSDYPFHTVGPWDAWVDDPTLPHYNQFVTVDPANPPPWFEKQKMRHGDFAYRWLVEILHNTDPATPGFGSAIFFHIRRGPTRPTAGCTTLAEENLTSLIRWLRADDHPLYVLLPRSEYLAKWKTWGLPPPEIAPIN